MRKVLFTIVCALSFVSARAQFYGITAGFTYTTAASYSESFADFFQSYNAYNADDLSTPFDTVFGRMSGPGWAVSFFANLGGVDVRANSGVNYMSTTNRNEFKRGQSRELKFTTDDWFIDFGVGPGNEHYYFNFNIGMLLRMSSLYSSYIYPNGYRSYTTSFNLNGIYESWRLTGNLGATLGINVVENAQLVYRIDYVFDATGDPTYRADFSDNQDFKTAPNSIIFPRDMNIYVNEIDLFNTVYHDFHGFRHSLTLQLSLFSE